MDAFTPSPLGEKVPKGRMRGPFHAAETAISLRSGRSELSLLTPLIRRFAPPSPQWGEGEAS
ncbi:hypothetical protein DXT94_25420 [Rhizobium sp. ICMP 5592]|nr:hypothetical protein [Rhizobium sp. ICMP 5592]